MGGFLCFAIGAADRTGGATARHSQCGFRLTWFHCMLSNSVLKDLSAISFARHRMSLAALLPKTTGNCEGIDLALLPPLPLFAGGVNVVVMDGAKRHGELVADLQTQTFGLGVAHMVGMRRAPSADNTRL